VSRLPRRSLEAQRIDRVEPRRLARRAQPEPPPTAAENPTASAITYQWITDGMWKHAASYPVIVMTVPLAAQSRLENWHRLLEIIRPIDLRHNDG